VPAQPHVQRALRTQGKETRARLLEAGSQVLGERGYLAARVDDVVRVAEMSHGTFYLYFANKEDLFRSLAEECAAEMEALAATLGPVPSGKRGENELREWLAGFVAAYRRHGPIIRAWMEDQLNDTTLTEVGLRSFARINTALERRLGEAGATHLTEPGVASIAMLGMAERLAYFTSSRELGYHDDQIVDTMTELLHRGLFGGRPSGRATTRRRATTSKRS
jgi:AcrR family transcriptional regulator